MKLLKRAIAIKKLISALMAVIMIVCLLTYTPDAFITSSAAQKGDADGDGGISVGDALIALRVAAKLAEATPDMTAACDVDGDGEITVGDALIILRIAAKLMPPFTEKALTSIAVTTKPTKTSYYKGDALDITGGKITAYYDDGSYEVVNMTSSMVSGFGSSTAGTKTLTVTYNGKIATFTVTVVEKTLTSIAVTTKPTKTTYIQDETLDVTGGKITAYYDNGSSEVVNMTASMISGFNSSTTGTKTLTVNYNGKNATFTVTVVEKLLTSIAVKTKPKTSYYQGETLDVTGGKITVYYDDGSSEVVNMTASMVSGFDSSTTGTKTLTVTYNGKTATFTITVELKRVTRAQFTAPPTKTTYIQDEPLDITGGRITVYYNNGSSEEVNMYPWNVRNFDSSTLGEKLLIVTYGNTNIGGFTITVVEKSMTSIAITTKPTKTTYIQDEPLDVTGGIITVYYDNGLSETVDMDTSMVISGFNSSTTGTKTLTVAYYGKRTTYTITVVEKSITSIAVITEPAKTTYIQDEPLDITGGKITVYYDNGSFEVVSMTASMVSGFDSSTAGTKTLVVTYNGKTATFNVIVNESNIVSSGSCGDNLIWTLYKSGNLTIRGTGDIWNYQSGNPAPWGATPISVTIDSGVTSIGEYAFWYCTGLTSITIPDSVTSIGEYAFWYCTGLTSVTIPDSVTVIGRSAFCGCTGLRRVTIPDSVTSIGGGAFSNCERLWRVDISDIAAWCGMDFGSDSLPKTYSLYLNGNIVTDLVIPDGVAIIGNNAFYGCTYLTSVTIPDSVTSIGDKAFYGCTDLTSVTIGKGVTSVDGSVFSGCSQLRKLTTGMLTADNLGVKTWTSVTLLDSVINIKDSAFSRTGLTIITISNSVTSIGSSAFKGCTGLTSVTIGSGVKSVDYSVFSGCTKLENLTTGMSTASSLGAYTWTSVTLLDSVTRIDDYEFRSCSGLTSLTIGKGVTSIGKEAFKNSTGLTKVEISDIAAWCGIDFGSESLPDVKHKLYLNGKLVTDLVIPDGVTSIGSSAFRNCTDLTSVMIPDSVTKIGDSAFKNCTGLTSVTIGDGVTSIGYYAFSGCTRLTSVFIGKGVTSIGAEAFSKCTCLTKVEISDIAAWCGMDSASSLTGYAPEHELYLNGKLVTDLVIPDSVTSIGGYTFQNCTHLTRVTIPNSVTIIDSSAFRNCTDLTSVTIPDSVTIIGGSAFNGCTGLTRLTIGKGVTSIGYYAFSGCTGLTSVTIPDSVTSVGENAFEGCDQLKKLTTGMATADGFGVKTWTSVILLDSVTSIANSAFKECAALISVTIPNSVTSIGNNAFNGCTGLTSVTIPDSVMSIGSYAFKNCTGLTSMTIPDSVTSVGENAFEGCDQLKKLTTGMATADGFGVKTWTSVTLLDSVTSIGGSAFNSCTGLTSVTIPNNVTTIYGSAFYGCTGLTSVTIPDSVTVIGRSAFSGCSHMKSVTIGNGVTTIGNNVFENCNLLKELTIGMATVDGFGVKTWTSVTLLDSVTSIGNSAFNGCTGLTRLTIGKGVTSIGDSAFSGCTGLTSITIPDSVTSIGSNAFKGCYNVKRLTTGTAGLGIASAFKRSLTDVVILSGVTTIGSRAFYGYSLTSVTIPDSVTSVGENAFNSCTGLTRVEISDIAAWCGIVFNGYSSNPLNYGHNLYLNGNLVTKLVIPDSVTSIGEYAFWHCTGLTSVTIPDSVTSIGNNAFWYCAGLESVTIPDSVTSIGSNAFSNCNNVTLYVSADSYAYQYAVDKGIKYALI